MPDRSNPACLPRAGIRQTEPDSDHKGEWYSSVHPDSQESLSSSLHGREEPAEDLGGSTGWGFLGEGGQMASGHEDLVG